MENYSFGKCIGCGKETALKNKKCIHCERKHVKKYPGLDFFEDLFGRFK